MTQRLFTDQKVTEQPGNFFKDYIIKPIGDYIVAPISDYIVNPAISFVSKIGTSINDYVLKPIGNSIYFALDVTREIVHGTPVLGPIVKGIEDGVVWIYDHTIGCLIPKRKEKVTKHIHKHDHTHHHHGVHSHDGHTHSHKDGSGHTHSDKNDPEIVDEKQSGNGKTDRKSDGKVVVEVNGGNSSSKNGDNTASTGDVNVNVNGGTNKGQQQEETQTSENNKGKEGKSVFSFLSGNSIHLNFGGNSSKGDTSVTSDNSSDQGSNNQGSNNQGSNTKNSDVNPSGDQNASNNSSNNDGKGNNGGDNKLGKNTTRIITPQSGGKSENLGGDGDNTHTHHTVVKTKHKDDFYNYSLRNRERLVDLRAQYQKAFDAGEMPFDEYQKIDDKLAIEENKYTEFVRFYANEKGFTELSDSMMNEETKSYFNIISEAMDKFDSDQVFNMKKLERDLGYDKLDPTNPTDNAKKEMLSLAFSLYANQSGGHDTEDGKLLAFRQKVNNELVKHNSDSYEKHRIIYKFIDSKTAPEKEIVKAPELEARKLAIDIATNIVDLEKLSSDQFFKMKAKANENRLSASTFGVNEDNKRKFLQVINSVKNSGSHKDFVALVKQKRLFDEVIHKFVNTGKLEVLKDVPAEQFGHFQDTLKTFADSDFKFSKKDSVPLANDPSFKESRFNRWNNLKHFGVSSKSSDEFNVSLHNIFAVKTDEKKTVVKVEPVRKGVDAIIFNFAKTGDKAALSALKPNQYKEFQTKVPAFLKNSTNSIHNYNLRKIISAVQKKNSLEGFTDYTKNTVFKVKKANK